MSQPDDEIEMTGADKEANYPVEPEQHPEQNMDTGSDTGSNIEASYFNIGVVARITDIQEATLRVWERRYNFPHANRTAGGHRLYSQRDIMRLKWVKLRVEEGMQVSKAIQALHQAEKEHMDIYALPPSTLNPISKPDDTPLSWFQKRVAEALLAHDAHYADHLLSHATVMFSIEQVIYHVITPTLAEIGDAWHEGRIDVATEHFATNLLRHTLFAWMKTAPPPFHVSPIVLTCAPNELHEGSLLMLAILLQRLRWPIVYLGQTMPLAELEAFIDSLKPAIVVFVAMRYETAHALAAWPHYLPKVLQTGHPIMGFGGRAFIANPELANHVQGVLLGDTLQDGVATLNRLMHELNPLLQ